MSEVIGILIVAAGTFGLRALPRLIDRARNGATTIGDFGDSTTHLLLIDMIRANGGRIFRATPHFTLSGPQDYPAFFHALMARIPRAMLERWEWASSPFWDALHAVTIYVFALVWFRNASLDNAAPAALLIALAWLLTPLFFRDPSRGSHLNERVFGFLLCDVFFLATIVAITSNSWAAAAIAVVAGALVTLSSKFGMQAIVFLTPVSALVLVDPRPIAVLIGTLVFAIVVSRGYALFVWRGTVRHSSFYARFLVKVHDYTTSFSLAKLVAAVKTCIMAVLSRSRTELRRGIAALLAHPFLQALTEAAVVWAGLAVFVLMPADTAFGALVTAACVVGVATMTDALKFLGEGIRYLEFAVLPALMILALAGLWWLVAVFVLYGAARQIMVLRRLWRNGARKSPAFRELSEWVGGQSPQTIVSVPGRLVFPLAYHARAHRWVWWFINAPDAVNEPRWRALFTDGGRYPFPSPEKVAQARTLYDADLVLLHKPSIDGARVAWGMDYGQVTGTVVYENAEYRALRLAPVLEAA
jgi:hypothetical protein